MLQTYSGAPARTWLKATLGTLGFCGALLAAPAAHAQVSTNNTPKLEAEKGIITGDGATKYPDATNLKGNGPSSGGYVDYNGENSSVGFVFTAKADGLHDVVIRYESRFGFKKADLRVGKNGKVMAVSFNESAVAGKDNFLNTNPITISLKAGSDTIFVAGGYNYYGIDYIQVAPSAATVATLTPSAAGRVEAEAGRLYYAQSLKLDADAAGSYSGTGYVSNFSDQDALGSSITLPVNVATAGLYQVTVGARRNVKDPKSFDLMVATGTSPGSKLTTQIPASAPTTFTAFPVGKYNMTAGTNTITITGAAYVDIDYVDITATTGVATAARASADAQKALSAYPNPTNGQALNVSLELEKAQEATFDLVNALGQRVSTATRSLRAGSNQLQLPTTGISGGLYQLVVRRGDQPTLVQRVVVN